MSEILAFSTFLDVSNLFDTLFAFVFCYFPNLVSKNWNPKEFCHRYSRTCCFQVHFGTLLVRLLALFFSPLALLSANLKVLISFAG